MEAKVKVIMELDFSKCKTKEDVEEVFKKNEEHLNLLKKYLH